MVLLMKLSGFLEKIRFNQKTAEVSLKIRTASVSDCGGKSINDDTVKILQERGVYVFVGDGLGGYAGGRMASEAAGEILIGLAKQENMTSEASLLQAAERANEAVKQLQEAHSGNMKTTCVFLGIEENMVRWMHIGDSRLYHFRRGKLLSQTKDHSVSQLAVMMGEITLAQIRHHEDRNRVLRALGAENAKPDISKEMEAAPGDAFLLCTDGFWEFVLEEEMEKLLKTVTEPDVWLKEMEKLLRERIPEDTDNYTAAAVFIAG